MKKAKIFLLLMLVLLIYNNSQAQAKSYNDPSGKFEYVENEDGTATITYCYITSEVYVPPLVAPIISVNVPSDIGGKLITKIGYRAFEGKMDMSIFLPDGLQEIEERAFSSCDRVNIYIPNSVTSIDESAFVHCRDEVTIRANPDSYARKYADEHGIKFSCITHSNIVTDAAVAPTYDSDGKTEGSHCAICGTVITESQVIPKLQVTTSALATTPQKGKTVTVSNSTYKVTSTGTNKTVEYSKAPSSKTSLTIPSTVTIKGKKYKVTSIAKNAFKNNKKLKKVTIGSNVTKIGSNAFKGCKNLKTITIKSKKITSFGKNAFKGINAKAKIKVPASKYKKYKKLLNGKSSTKKEKYKVL